MKRYQQLDFFRGFLLIVITVDHFLTYNNVIKRFTSEFVGWVSAAEGFVFISGLTAGLVYTYKFNEKGIDYITDAAKRRAIIIYRNHIILFLITFLAVIFISPIGKYWLETTSTEGSYALFFEKPVWALTLGSVLLYQPMLLDILPMYALFMLLVPLAIKAFHKGWSWQLLVTLAVTYGLSTSNHLFGFTDVVIKNNSYVVMGAFHILCWQLLFFLGLFAGFSIYHGRTIDWSKNRVLLFSAVTICLILFCMKNFHIEIESVNMNILTDKFSLGIIRLLNFISLTIVLFFVVEKVPKYFTLKPICYLGRYSLEVFSLHILLVIFIRPLKDYFNYLHAVRLTENFYFYPVGTLFLLLIVLPALFLAPKLAARKKIVLKQAAVAPDEANAKKNVVMRVK